jgi:hypothetical protein
MRCHPHGATSEIIGPEVTGPLATRSRNGAMPEMLLFTSLAECLWQTEIRVEPTLTKIQKYLLVREFSAIANLHKCIAFAQEASFTCRTVIRVVGTGRTAPRGEQYHPSLSACTVKGPVRWTEKQLQRRPVTVSESEHMDMSYEQRIVSWKQRVLISR